MNRVQNYAGQSGKIRAGCVISIVVVVLLVIGGGIAAVFWGMGKVEDAVKEAIQGDPVIVQHIGEITDIGMNWTATGQAAENQNKAAGEKHNFLVLDLVGTKGKGKLTVQMDQKDDVMAFTNGTLEMADGKSYDLALPKSAPPAEDTPKKDAPAEKGEPVGVGK